MAKPIVPVNPVSSIMASAVALKPAVLLLMAIKVRVVLPLVKVNCAAELALKAVVVKAAPIPVASKVAIAPTSINPDRAVATRNKSLPTFALKSVIISKLYFKRS